jgi:hypothetical protein
VRFKQRRRVTWDGTQGRYGTHIQHSGTRGRKGLTQKRRVTWNGTQGRRVTWNGTQGRRVTWNGTQGRYGTPIQQ